MTSLQTLFYVFNLLGISSMLGLIMFLYSKTNSTIRELTNKINLLINKKTNGVKGDKFSISNWKKLNSKNYRYYNNSSNDNFNNNSSNDTASIFENNHISHANNIDEIIDNSNSSDKNNNNNSDNNSSNDSYKNNSVLKSKKYNKNSYSEISPTIPIIPTIKNNIKTKKRFSLKKIKNISTLRKSSNYIDLLKN